ncbi:MULTISPECIES: helix-turn-helix domain-containing protein [unclassified Sphingobacterium]|uniref:helix-turn-helix domain-containing protein n=1 Tax=unclassified Sphingobacterium TaxID=2609468 RepID=UPI0025D53784|nr:MULTISPECIES: helix-turn-helix domain-containing protein [unclassified Sphingobacterium]
MYKVAMYNTIKTLLSHGKSIREIASELGMCRKTVSRIQKALERGLEEPLPQVRPKLLDDYLDDVQVVFVNAGLFYYRGELLKLSRFYRLSIDTLLQIDLAKIGELKLRELENGDDIYIKGGNIRVLAITVDRSNNENVEYVPIKGKAGYAAGGFADTDFIAELPKYYHPNLPKYGTFRTFPIEGDSMLPFPEAMDVTGRFVSDWNTIKPNTLSIIVLKGQDIVFKDITVKDSGNILCRS